MWGQLNLFNESIKLEIQHIVEVLEDEEVLPSELTEPEEQVPCVSVLRLLEPTLKLGVRNISAT